MGVSGVSPASLPGQVCLVWGSEAQLLPKKVAQDWHLSRSKPKMNHRPPRKMCVWGATQGELCSLSPWGPPGLPIPPHPSLSFCLCEMGITTSDLSNI